MIIIGLLWWPSAGDMASILSPQRLHKATEPLCWFTNHTLNKARSHINPKDPKKTKTTLHSKIPSKILNKTKP